MKFWPLSILVMAALTIPLRAEPAQPYRGRVLVVVTAHADDFSIFAGGSIAKLIGQGYTGYLVRITDDEKSGGPDQQSNAARNDREVREVARILGLRAVYSLNFQNDELGRVPHERIRDAVMFYLRKLKADTIYTFDPYAGYGEENPDHLAAGRAVEDAARNSGNPRYAPEQLRAGVQAHAVEDGYYWTRAPIEVNTVMDTSAYLDRKMEALAHHHAQFPESDVPYYRRHDRDVGKIYGMAAAEVSHHIRYRDSAAAEEAGLKAVSPAAPPDAFAGKVIAVVSPHGMDYVKAVGGVIARAARQGAHIYLIRVTDDEKHGGSLPMVEARVKLREETRKAAEIIGIERVIDLNLKDGDGAEVAEPELRLRLAIVFRALAPDAVFTVDPWASYDPDSDDARIGHAVEDACWNSASPSIHPEFALAPATRFKGIADRYFWTMNGGEQPANDREDISSTRDLKLAALKAMPTAIPAPDLGTIGSVESFYHYRAANPLNWLLAWLRARSQAQAPEKPAVIGLERGAGRKALVITPEASDWLTYARGTVARMAASGYAISLVRIGNDEKSSGIPSSRFERAARATGVSRIFNFGFREGELSAAPALLVRDRLIELLRELRPDVILLPDAWQPYVTHEAMVVGHLGADAVYQWKLAEHPSAPVRMFFWQGSAGDGAVDIAGQLARKRSALRELRLPEAGAGSKEYFHPSRMEE